MNKLDIFDLVPFLLTLYRPTLAQEKTTFVYTFLLDFYCIFLCYIGQFYSQQTTHKKTFLLIVTFTTEIIQLNKLVKSRQLQIFTSKFNRTLHPWTRHFLIHQTKAFPEIIGQPGVSSV